MRRTKLPPETIELIQLLSKCGIGAVEIAGIVGVNPQTASKYRRQFTEGRRGLSKPSRNESLRRIIQRWASGDCSTEAKGFLRRHFIDPYLKEICDAWEPLVWRMTTPLDPWERLCQTVFGRADLPEIVFNWFEGMAAQEKYRPTVIREEMERRLRDGEVLPVWEVRTSLVRRALLDLSSRQREALNLRYGLDGKPPQTFRAIGEQLGVGNRRAFDIHKAACRQLRQHPVCRQPLTWLGVVEEGQKRQTELEEEIENLKGRLAQLKRRMEIIRALADGAVPSDSADLRELRYLLFPQEIPVEGQDLSMRAKNCLRKAQIMTLDDLCQQTADDLLGLRNFGEKCLGEVIAKLKSFGLQLREDTKEDRFADLYAGEDGFEVAEGDPEIPWGNFEIDAEFR